MMSAVVWVCAATAPWHFSILVPDRFYGGLIGALLAATGGAVVVAAFAAGWPGKLDETGLLDVLIATAGALLGLAVSYLIGRRFDPVTGHARRGGQ
jgi:hypothetical protein